MRIEMCGPPTAGKSSLVKALKASGIRRGKKARIEKIPEEWKFFEDYINFVYKDTTYQKLPDKTLTALASAWKGSNSKKWCVFDEALILCGFSLAIRMPEYAEEYFKQVPLPELLVVMNANKKTLLKRNIKRGEKNRPEKTVKCIEAHEIYLPILIERGCNIFYADSTKKQPAQIAKEIIGKLNEYL